jgi:lipopolysaccharide/colanic/teichoic acid biosynthesis glycosyltransferase
MYISKSENNLVTNSQSFQKESKEMASNGNTKKSFFVINTIVGLSIYLFTFFMWYFFKRDTFLLEDKYDILCLYYLLALFIASILSNKAFLTPKHEIMQSLRKIYISVFLALGILSVVILQTYSNALSRFVIIGSILSGALIESLYFYLVSEKKSIKRIIKTNPISYFYIIPDFILLTVIVYLVIIKNIGIDNINEKHVLTIVLIYLSWNYSALFTHRFNPLKQSINNWSATGLQLKFYLLILSSTSIFIFVLNIRPEYWGYFFQCVSVYSIFSFIIFLFLYVRKLPYPTDEVTNIFLKAFELRRPNPESIKSQKTGKYKFLSGTARESVVKQKMQIQYFKDFPDVFNFLERELELQSFDASKTFIIRSSDFYNVEVLENSSLELFVNLHEINDLRRINDYFRLINEKLLDGGIYCGCLIPIKNRHLVFQKKYPFLISNIFYFLDFLKKRVSPKLPGIRKLYFSLTKGKDRSISLAEGLGRLVYCGFEIIDLTEISDFIFYVAQKVNEPSKESNPSYSLIFKMKRIGQNGKPIYVYKIRTMHPYSEFLQSFVYDKNKLTLGGKFKDDFRISSWGKILRKLWIDELPMILNLIKGDIKLVGVRPVSSHYLSLYSTAFQQRRIKYKPGLIPPFYADMPNTIEEIEISEIRYFDLYDQSPFITDVKYFFKIVFNIIFHRKRSA